MPQGGPVMLEELCWTHARISTDECMRIILTRDNWEVRCDKTDIVGIFNGCFRIVRSNGRIVSINPEQVAMVCTMPKGSGL